MKVFVETSPLLAASIYYDKGKIAHKKYDVSKSLFNYFKDNISLQVGITSDTVISQAGNTLLKAIEDTVLETNKSTPKDQLFYDTISRIKDNSEDKLRLNIKLLGKYPLSEEEVDKIKPEIDAFFREMQSFTRQKGKFYSVGIRLHSATKRMIARGNRPFFKGIPDFVDKIILAEVTYIKRTFLKQEPLFLASLDKDFSPGKDCIIRDKLFEKFQVFCDWPENIYKELKKKS